MGLLDLRFLKPKPRLLLWGVAVASVLAVGFTFTTTFVFTSSGGSLSPYLVGYFDFRTADCVGAACADTTTGGGIMDGRTDAAVDLTNPTTTPLFAVISLFNNDGSFIACTTRTVTANETVRLFVNDSFTEVADGDFGVIKIVTVLNSNTKKVQAGVKGWLTHFVTESSDNAQAIFSRHSQLQEVPVEVLKKDGKAELELITQSCA